MKKIKVISKGKYKGRDTAEIVVITDGKSQTKHLWYYPGSGYADSNGKYWDVN